MILVLVRAARPRRLPPGAQGNRHGRPPVRDRARRRRADPRRPRLSTSGAPAFPATSCPRSRSSGRSRSRSPPTPSTTGRACRSSPRACTWSACRSSRFSPATCRPRHAPSRWRAWPCSTAFRPNGVRLLMVVGAGLVLILVALPGPPLLERAVRETTLRLNLTRYLPARARADAVGGRVREPAPGAAHHGGPALRRHPRFLGPRHRTWSRASSPASSPPFAAG